jgi:hypothetical protein
MGAFARLREKFRQTTNKDDATFKKTGNDRCTETFREAGNFADQLKEIRRTIKALRAATEGMLRQTDKALSTPLPRVFDTEPTTGKPVPSAPAVMGTENENVEDAVRIGTLNEIAHQTGTKMEQEVLAPMEQWLRLFQGFRGKLEILERRRLDLDAARRQYNRLEQKRVKKSENNQEPPAELIIQIQAKETTLNARRGAFEMYEAQVHEELSQLVGDSGALHKFLEAALRLESHAFESALGPVSPSLVHLTEGSPSLLESQKGDEGYANSEYEADYPNVPNAHTKESEFPSVPLKGRGEFHPVAAKGPNTPPQANKNSQPIAA